MLVFIESKVNDNNVSNSWNEIYVISAGKTWSCHFQGKLELVGKVIMIIILMGYDTINH